jgi:methyl-accepting chemotaxis protein
MSISDLPTSRDAELEGTPTYDTPTHVTWDGHPTGAHTPDTGGDGGGLTRQRILRFGAVIALMSIVAVGVAIWSSRQQETDTVDVRSTGLAALSLEQAMGDGTTVAQNIFARGVALSSDAGDLAQQFTDAGLAALADYQEHLGEVAAYVAANGVAANEMATVQELADSWIPTVAPIFEAPAFQLDPETFAAAVAPYQALRDAEEVLSDVLEEHGGSAAADAADTASRGQLLTALAALLALVVVVVAGSRMLKALAAMNSLQSEASSLRGRERVQSADLEAKVDAMLHVIDRAAMGDLTVQVPVSGDDAIGRMGTALRKLLGDLRRSIKSIAQNSEALAAAAEELQVVSRQMDTNSTATSTQVARVSESTTEVAHHVSSVSASTEEMSASIREIAQNAADAARVAAQAVDAARETNTIVAQLGQSSNEIGQIVKVITGIAQQTDLLALNATIEAARAGEAGKGFAVVANEVKELATETGKATEDISAKIQAIQTDTKRSMESIASIQQIINQISEFQDTIASAVEEQSATTTEISRSINVASQGSTQITDNMRQVASAAESTASGAADSQNAAAELARMASELQSLVSAFTY